MVRVSSSIRLHPLTDLSNTCRSRHVKCDEQKPSCRQCGKKGRTCVYDRIQPNNVRHHELQDNEHRPLRYHDCSVEARSYLELTDATFPKGRPRLPKAYEYPTFSLASPSADLASILRSADWEDKGSEGIPSTSFRTTTPARLEGAEVLVFRNYVHRVSHWLDAFTRDKPFSSSVPALALHCPVLLHSCLAYSGRQIALTAHGQARSRHEALSVYYYRTALHTLGRLLHNAECVRSDEILASSMILSAYEMLDMIGDSFASHLKGLAALLQAQGVNGSDIGVRGAVFWAWYRHESWSCMLVERSMTLNEDYWQPNQVSSFTFMTQEEIVNRVTFIYGQIVSFCNDRANQERQSERHFRHEKLKAALAEWKEKLPSWMVAFSIDADPADVIRNKRGALSRQNTFESLWFIYPQASIAHQAYHAAKILLDLHLSGQQDRGSLAVRRRIEHSREQICLVASSSVPEEWAFVSIQCLFVAGLVTEGKEERQRTLDIIAECQRISGRQTWSIADRLQKSWSMGYSSDSNGNMAK